MASDDDQIDILLIEPNAADTRLFTEQFKDAKLTNNLHAVSDGEAAVEFVRQRGDHAATPCPDLILLEPNLPGKTGRDVLSELNGDPQLSEIPVVVLTSSDAEEEIVKSHGLDADHFIRKPIEPAEFIDFVRTIEDFWLAIVQKSAAGD
ncbi:response regulator [Natronoarchaeum rubrum]|uniref:response regulator n=1 Tax=Natronoarchaeum rubrum TaxID=755311 RepID=UPI002111295B|nr:response regulator [Natronoarchaeum rubrum]